MMIPTSIKISELEIQLTNCVKVVMQLQVQLEGCSVAALGGITNPVRKGNYGWSSSYQDVLDLRIKFDNLERQVRGNVGWVEEKEVKEYDVPK